MKIREIINSGQAPSSPQDLWLDRGSLKYFSGSGGKAINTSVPQYFSLLVTRMKLKLQI